MKKDSKNANNHNHDIYTSISGLSDEDIKRLDEEFKAATLEAWRHLQADYLDDLMQMKWYERKRAKDN